MDTLEGLDESVISGAAPASTPVAGAMPATAAPAPGVSDRFQETWQKAKRTARDVRRSATESWEDVAEGLDRRVKERPVAVALGAGLALGLLAGVALGLAVRRSTS